MIPFRLAQGSFKGSVRRIATSDAWQAAPAACRCTRLESEKLTAAWEEHLLEVIKGCSRRSPSSTVRMQLCSKTATGAVGGQDCRQMSSSRGMLHPSPAPFEGCTQSFQRCSHSRLHPSVQQEAPGSSLLGSSGSRN